MPLPAGGLLPPDLVIQDELHLISGPLGTVIGLYETAIDALCARKEGDREIRPKIIASTAKVAEAKTRLDQAFHEEGRVDVALATNMISVGLDIVRLGLMVVVGQPKMTSEYIQATSRVGRDADRPGLVVTLLNLHRPRDRSHDERFNAFHASFYRSIEATSVTPFSPRAVDRGLAGAMVALARQGWPPLTPSQCAVRMRMERGKMDFVAEAMSSRAAGHDSSLLPHDREELRQRTRGRVSDLLDDGVKLADRQHQVGAGLKYQKHEPGASPFLLRDPTDPEWEEISPEQRRFRAHHSMRDVELSVNLWAKTLDGRDVLMEEE